MRNIIFWSKPYLKEELTHALESGAGAVIVPDAEKESVSAMSRNKVLAESEVHEIKLESQADEAKAHDLLQNGEFVILAQGWEIIPVENLLARMQGNKEGELALEISNMEEALLAVKILEKGVRHVVLKPDALKNIGQIFQAIKTDNKHFDLKEAVITDIKHMGMGHRVCVDTLSLLSTGQGMLVGNSSAFSFLVNAETENNEYVASRPFRINAGPVHAYAFLPQDKTSYLEELRAGAEVLIVDAQGNSQSAVVGRVKIEQRPMLLINALCDEKEGSIFLQNAETIRLVKEDGKPVSVVDLKIGDKVLCHLDDAGRHFGMRIDEDIKEV